MTTQTITPQHFAALVALTSIRPGGKTHEALRCHMVLGMTQSQAASHACIAVPVLYRAIDTLDHAAMRAREYVRIAIPEETAAQMALPPSQPGAPGSLS